MNLYLPDLAVLVFLDLHKDRSYNNQILSLAKRIVRGTDKKVIAVTVNYSDTEQRGYDRFGLDYLVNLKGYCVDACVKIARQIKPYLLMACCDRDNKAMLAQIATDIGSGLVADCIEIRSEHDKMIFSRAAINDSVIADIECVNAEFMACTVKKDCFLSEECGGNTEYIEYAGEFKQDIGNPSFTLISEKMLDTDMNQCISSKVIIGVGRGAVKNLDKIKIFANRIHADIGTTRALVDKGIMDRKQQIGQSGSIIGADVYLALGISGASQHQVGLSKVKMIIAVNIDKDAPICRFANVIFHESVEDFMTKISRLTI